MNTTEAKFILQARRPDGRDDGDPQFAEALEQARRDPTLAAWMAHEQAFDEAVAQKLRAVQPPAGLREAILAGARVSNRRPVPFWRRPQVLAMAASLAIIAGLALAWPVKHSADGSDRLALGVMNEVDSVAHHTAMPSPRGELRTLLASTNTHLAAGLPLTFDQLKADGCRSLKIAGHDVLEVCFERGGEGFHLYVASRKDFHGDGEPMFRERGTLASVAWNDDRHAYVLVSADGSAALRNIF
jgi:hypothetical protein